MCVYVCVCVCVCERERERENLVDTAKGGGVIVTCLKLNKPIIGKFEG